MIKFYVQFPSSSRLEKSFRTFILREKCRRQNLLVFAKSITVYEISNIYYGIYVFIKNGGIL